ncbi:MAG: DNA-processing protein DprA [Oscillospiraceae bacterium]|nr:DNA-processing protein DprA [Oscillospiraceae bacterium]
MNEKHKWIALALSCTGKKYALDRLAQEYKNIPDTDPRFCTPAAQALIRSLENSPIKDVTVVCYPDPEYPEKLRNLNDPPAQLYIRGNAKVLDSGIIAAVVGSRDASAYGLSVTADFCRDFCEAGLTVISGGARGVDSAAAETVLICGGKTIAVLGSGVDVSYPARNKDLFDKIAASGGAVISEYHFGSQPIQANFPRRNRIIAALGDCCVVTEAGLRSGSLITANLASDLRRPLFAVPGNITSHGSTGTNHLIKTGAALAESGAQVAAELKALLSFSAAHTVPGTNSSAKVTHGEVTDPQPKSSKFTRVATHEASSVKADLSANERSIIAAIKNGCATVAEIAGVTGLGEVTLAPELIMMELKGLIRKELSGYSVV